MMNSFLQPLQEMAEFEQISKAAAAAQGIVAVSGCTESQKAHLMYGLSGLFPFRLILAEDERRAREIFEDYRFYDENTLFYPARDLLFFQADVHGNLLGRQRMQVVQHLMTDESVTIVTSIEGCMDYLSPLSAIENKLITCRTGGTLDMTAFRKKLSSLGYEAAGQVEMPGQFSVRGGILDVYPITGEEPVRIELWGDEIDSIRSFDPKSQRSIENMEELTIFPAAEDIPSRNRMSFIDYFDPDRTLIFLDEPNRLSEQGEIAWEEYSSSRKHREESGNKNPLPDWMWDFSSVRRRLNSRRCVSLRWNFLATSSILKLGLHAFCTIYSLILSL